MAEVQTGPPPAAEIPDVPVLQALGDRRSIRYFDEAQTVEDWKIETMLQAARFASCQGNINCTEAILVRRDECDVWDELEECVSGFNVQIINQASHLIIWLTNLNAWYGRAVDGISTVSLAGAMSKYRMLRRLPSARRTGTSGISVAGGGPVFSCAIDAPPMWAYTVIPR